MKVILFNIFSIILILFFQSSFGQLTKTNSLFQSIVSNPRTELDRKSYPEGVIKEFYELKFGINEWIAFKEFYANRQLKEIGIFLNGYNYGVWKKYDSLGLEIEEIDYSIPKKTLGKNQPYEGIFQNSIKIADSIIKSHFDSNFIKNQIRLNAPRSYWYTKENSGSWFEIAKNEPEEFNLRYSIVINDSTYFTPIEIKFERYKTLKAKIVSGRPNTSNYKININFNSALEIAHSKGFRLAQHETAFKKFEYLSLIFDKGNYYWIISSIPKTLTEGYPNSYSRTITAIGKTLKIDCATGETYESDFNGVINICD